MSNDIPPEAMGPGVPAGTSIAATSGECACCLGDPDLVCDACGSHSCWAGEFMCGDAQSAGVMTASAWVAWTS